MPRDATLTRAAIVRHAERLFATRGLHQVTVREITAAAGQRNPSVVHYHFGSMQGLRDEILAGHERPLDTLRGEMVARLGDQPSTRDLVGALVVPYSQALLTESGRDFLQIVDQLRPGFAGWARQESVSPHLVRILRVLRERMAHLPTATADDRIVALIVLISGMFAERARAARRVVGGHAADEEAFRDNLVAMLVAMLDAR